VGLALKTQWMVCVCQGQERDQQKVRGRGGVHIWDPTCVVHLINQLQQVNKRLWVPPWHACGREVGFMVSLIFGLDEGEDIRYLLYVCFRHQLKCL